MGGRLCWCVFVCGLCRWDMVVHACVHVCVMYTYAGNICLVVSGSASAHVFHMCFIGAWCSCGCGCGCGCQWVCMGNFLPIQEDTVVV